MSPAPHVTRIDPDDERIAGVLLDLDDLVWAASGKVPREVGLRHTPTRAGFLATLDGENAGLAGSWDVQLSVPAPGGGAGLRPAEGLTWVGVHPDHRRRGVLSALMRHHLRWTREEQQRSISVLKASEPSIYGRFGYGIASSTLRSVLSRGTTFSAPPVVQDLAGATTTRTTTQGPEQAERVLALLEQAGAGEPGHVVRDLEDYRRILTDIPQSRGSREPGRLLWATREGVDVGLAWFHRTSKWSDDINPEGEVEVILFAALDAGARLALATRLGDLDLMAKTTCWLAVDDPLALWLPSLRTLGGAMTDDLWLRIVDLPLAVSERGHAGDVDLVLEVSDEIIGENAGRWRWQSLDGFGELTAHDGSSGSDLTLDIRDLSAVWLGGQTVAARAAAGFVLEHRPGAVAELDAALRTPTLPVGTLDF